MSDMDEPRTEELAALERLAKAATPGPWRGTTEGSYDQKHAAAKAFEAIMARVVPDLPDAQWSDLSWVRTEGDDWLNVALIGNGKDGPENAAYIAAVSPDVVLGLIEQVRATARPAVGEEGLRERIGAVIDRWYHLGMIRFGSRDDGSDDLFLRDELVRAALADKGSREADR